MKKCNTCKKEKDLSEFDKNKCRPDGYQHRCKECRKEYFKEDYERNKSLYLNKNKQRRFNWKNWISDLKLKCEKCSEDNTWCLEFHHKNKEKKDFSISNIIGSQSFSERWKKVVLDEINKCSILCANCHRKEHYNEYFGD
jgi:hypothetical protein